jgi:hypothetical protein
MRLLANLGMWTVRSCSTANRTFWSSTSSSVSIENTSELRGPHCLTYSGRKKLPNTLGRERERRKKKDEGKKKQIKKERRIREKEEFPLVLGFGGK